MMNYLSEVTHNMDLMDLVTRHTSIYYSSSLPLTHFTSTECLQKLVVSQIITDLNHPSVVAQSSFSGSILPCRIAQRLADARASVATPDPSSRPRI